MLSFYISKPLRLHISLNFHQYLLCNISINMHCNPCVAPKYVLLIQLPHKLQFGYFLEDNHRISQGFLAQAALPLQSHLARRASARTVWCPLAWPETSLQNIWTPGTPGTPGTPRTPPLWDPPFEVFDCKLIASLDGAPLSLLECFEADRVFVTIQIFDPKIVLFFSEYWKHYHNT